MRFNKEKLKEQFVTIADKLNSAYEPVDEKPLIKIAELTVVFTTMGFFYIWLYLQEFGINYFYYFNISDSIEVLYNKLMPIIFISVILSPLMAIILPDLFKKSTEKRITVISVVILIIFIISVFYILFSVYKFSLLQKAIFLFLIGFTSIIYLFKQQHLGLIMLIIVGFIYIFAVAHLDAKLAKEEKLKYNSTPNEYIKVPLLLEGNNCRYLIYRTQNYTFVKDDCNNLIYVQSRTTGEIESFTSKSK